MRQEDPLDEEFDPKAYTVKSFMQMLYSQNQDLLQRTTAIEKDVERLTNDLERREQRAKDEEKRWSTRLKWVGAIGLIVGFFIDYLLAKFF